MSFFTIETANTVVDLVGLCLCFITILYLIKNIIFSKEPGSNNSPQQDNMNFSREVFLQQLQFECENSFKKLSDSFNDELRNIDGLIKKRKIGLKKEGSSENKKKKTPNTVLCQNDTTCFSDFLVKPYEEVVRMVDMGLSINNISKQVKIPKGEIEHIIQLKSPEKYIQQGEIFA